VANQFGFVEHLWAGFYIKIKPSKSAFKNKRVLIARNLATFCYRYCLKSVQHLQN
jgi:hypothetical protein